MDAVNDTLNTTLNATTTQINSPGAILASSVLFFLAVLPIYFGSLFSHLRKNELEIISQKDAMKFPLVASCALFGIYALFKIIPQVYINMILNVHFSFLAVGSMFHIFGSLFAFCYPKFLKKYKFGFTYSKSEEISENAEHQWKAVENHAFELVSDHIPGLLVSLAIGAWYFITKNWISNNFVAVTFALLAIEYIRLDKFMNGCILLGGLFFYDIFWVFGTPVMVTVAKSLDAPIKVTFPRDFFTYGIFGKEQALLGLGDIVIPGIFVAMLLRFDYSLNRGGSKIYFYTGYVAYIVGLLITFVVMHTFKAAQPALLYLVPTCLGFPFGLAWVRGDLEAMFAYKDTPEETEDTTSQSENSTIESKKSN